MLNISLLGDDIADIAPHDVALAMGWLGQYLYIIPSRNMSIVSLGATWGSSLQCPLGNALPTDPVYNDGYDDTYSATQHWLAMDAATTPSNEQHLNLEHDPAAAAELAAADTAAAATAAATAAAAAATATAGGPARVPVRLRPRGGARP